MIHGKSLTSKIFRKVYAAFALNQKNFFGSSDVQLLRIGTVLKGGVLLSTASSNHEHIFNIFSVSIVPEMGQDFLEAFGSVVTQEDYEISREDCGLIFEIKLVASQFWQIKIRILLNSASKNKLEELILGKHLVVKERSFVEKIIHLDTNDKNWMRILYGVQEKKGLSTSNSLSDKEYPCPLTKPLCYSTSALQGPHGVMDTLKCVGLPRQEATLLRLELIAAAMRQMPDFQTFLKDTKWERGMEPDDIHGILIFALSQNNAPV